MAYVIVNWVNDQTPLSAENLNQMDLGIKAAHNLIEGLQNTSDSQQEHLQEHDQQVVLINEDLDAKALVLTNHASLLSGLRTDVDLNLNDFQSLKNGTLQIQEVLLPSGVKIQYDAVDEVIQFVYPNGVNPDIVRKIHSKLGLLADVTITAGAVNDVMIRTAEGEFVNQSKADFLSDAAKLSVANTFAEVQTFLKQTFHTLGADMNSQKIINVANGTADGDAINYGQLKLALDLDGDL